MLTDSIDNIKDIRLKNITTFFLIAFATNCFSQINEFEKSTKGLLYSDKAINKIKLTVDSINSAFKTSEAHYLCRPIAKANSVIITTKNARKAKKDIDAGISFEDLIKKYKSAKVDKEILIWKFRELDWSSKNSIAFEDVRVRFDTGIVKGVNEVRIYDDLDSYTDVVKGKWVYTYYKKADKYEETIRAFYFTEDFTQKEIPEKYNQYIQYANILLDTGTQVCPPKTINMGQPSPQSRIEFMDYANSCNERPELAYRKNISIEDYNIREQKKFDHWYSIRWRIMDSLKAHDPTFTKLLLAAYRDTSLLEYSTSEYADYIGRYCSRYAELEIRRQSCMLSGFLYNNPNCKDIPSLKIAKLAAETGNWKVFLPSHLGIMNGHFDCTSEIDYARPTRKAYLKELEILDVNVFNLFMGVGLFYLSPRGYYMDCEKLGVALSEATNPDEIETEMLKIISDNSLDDFNRLVVINLFQTYNINLTDKDKQIQNNNKLRLVVKTLPEYLSKNIVFLETK
jgi:hypothetical protein